MSLALFQGASVQQDRPLMHGCAESTYEVPYSVYIQKMCPVLRAYRHRSPVSRQHMVSPCLLGGRYASIAACHRSVSTARQRADTKYEGEWTGSGTHTWSV